MTYHLYLSCPSFSDHLSKFHGLSELPYPRVMLFAIVKDQGVRFRTAPFTCPAAKTVGCSWLTTKSCPPETALHQKELTYPRLQLFSRGTSYSMTGWCRGTKTQLFWLNQRHLCRAIPTLFSQWDQLRIQLCWTTLHFNFSLCLILLPLLPCRFIHQIKCLYKNLHFRVCLAGKET